MLAGSDAACEGVIPGYGLHDQLRLFVDAGLTPLEALRTAITEPAAYFRKQNERGRLAAGYDADILLLSADPTRNIRAVASIDAMVLRGQLVQPPTSSGPLRGGKSP